MIFLWIYFTILKSAKRKEDFHDFQLFTNTKPLKVIKHCKTRWLSLEKAVQRVVLQWPALLAYFDSVSESDHSARVRQLDQHFKSHLTKLIMLFLKFALDSMCKFNVAFQSSVPMLPALKSEVQRLLRILFGRFIQAEVIQNISGNDLTDIDVKEPQLQLADEQLGIGQEAWAYLSSEEDSLDPSAERLFFNGIRQFYVAIASTIIRKFPFNDTLVDDVAVFLPNNRSTIDCTRVYQLARRFTIVVPQESMDALEEEVIDYKLSPIASFPDLGDSDGASSTEFVHTGKKLER